mmetsp:Transcript_38315/g.64364  ORF Transcript_38315/g.64364 Transcript_38315/m.64364 type:complete len:275 (-) Transcript_38315:110-934(-)
MMRAKGAGVNRGDRGYSLFRPLTFIYLLLAFACHILVPVVVDLGYGIGIDLLPRETSKLVQLLEGSVRHHVVVVDLEAILLAWRNVDELGVVNIRLHELGHVLLAEDGTVFGAGFVHLMIVPVLLVGKACLFLHFFVAIPESSQQFGMVNFDVDKLHIREVFLEELFLPTEDSEDYEGENDVFFRLASFFGKLDQEVVVGHPLLSLGSAAFAYFHHSGPKGYEFLFPTHSLSFWVGDQVAIDVFPSPGGQVVTQESLTGAWVTGNEENLFLTFL